MSNIILPGDRRWVSDVGLPRAVDKRPVISLPASPDVVHSSTHKRFTPWRVTLHVVQSAHDTAAEKFEWFCLGSSPHAAAFTCGRFWYIQEKFRFDMGHKKWPDLHDDVDVEQLDDMDYKMEFDRASNDCPYLFSFGRRRSGLFLTPPTLFYGYRTAPKWWPPKMKKRFQTRAFTRPFFPTRPVLDTNLVLKGWEPIPHGEEN